MSPLQHIRKNSNLAVTAVLLLTLAGIFIVYFFFIKQSGEASAWHETGWLYRQGVPITNTGAELTDYQVAVTIDTATLIGAGKMQSNCQDARFAGRSGKELPYWIESGCNTATTKIWVKTDRVPKNSASTTPVVYMYYGNPNAPAGQNGDETFLLFDDFQNGLAKWDAITKGASDLYSAVSQTNGVARLAPQDSTQVSANMVSHQTFTNGIAIEARRKQDVENNYMDFSLGSGKIQDVLGGQTLWRVTMKANGYYFRILDATGGGVSNYIAKAADDAAYTQLATVGPAFPVTVSYSRHRYIYETDGDLWWYANDAYMRSATDTDYLSNSKNLMFTQGEHTDSGGAPQSIDWVFVRKYGNQETEPAIGTIQTEEKSKDPVGYWSFDEGYGTIAGDSAQNNDGAITGAVWKNEDECVKGKCLYFDGTGDYVTATGTPLNNLKTAVTVSAWVQPEVLTSDMGIIDKDRSVGGFTLDWDTTDDVFRFGGDSTINAFASSTRTINAGQWYYLVGVYDGTNLKIYVNGVLEGTKANTTNFTNDQASILIGNTDDSHAFAGRIDEPRIYPYARTAAEVKADYASSQNKGATANIGEKEQTLNDGLVGHWKMDEASWNGTAGEVLDASGGGNNGQAVGAGGITGTSSTSKYGRAGEFDGTDDYVTAMVDNALDTSGPHTYAVWAKLDAYNADRAIMGDTGASGGSVLYYQSGNICAYYLDTNKVCVTAITGSWNHYVLTDDDKTLYFYIDGVLRGTAESVTVDGGILYIGTYNARAQSAFDGLIDDARVYTRALSASEVTRLYETAPPPVLHMKFDEGTGSIANNSASSTFFGNLIGTPTRKSSAECRFGGCLSLDGSDDQVQFSSPASINLSTIHTASFWAKGNTNIKGIMGSTSTNGAFVLIGGVIYYYTSASVNVGWTYSPDNNWHHYAFSRNGTSIILYIDGVSQGTQTLGANEDLTVTTIGSWAGNYRWIGSLDDVRIYNYARTQKQILEDMNAGAPIQSVRAESNGMASGLVGYWKFDDVQMASTSAYTSARWRTSDSSGRGNNADVYNATSTPGKFGKAVGFDGTSDYGVVGDSVIDSSGAHSYSVWAKINTWTDGDALLGDYSGSGGSMIYESGTPAQVCLWITSAVGCTSIAAGEWHYYTVTDDNTNAYFYIDGNLKIKTSSISVDGVDFYLGAYTPGITASCDGNMDEVKIYNYALSAEDILKDYNQGKVLKVAPAQNPTTISGGSGMHPGGSAPVMHITLDEKTGTTSTDRSGNGNDAGFIAGTTAPTWQGSGYCAKGACMSFDGTSDTMATIRQSSLQTIPSGSISLWIKYDVAGLNSTLRTALDLAGTGGNGLVLWANTAANVPGLGVGTGGGFSTISSTKTFQVGKWYHLVATWTPSFVAIYTNGVLDNSTSITTAISPGAGTSYIGSQAGAIRFHSGYVDDVKIWNRALSIAEVAYEYNGGKPIGHWKLDEGHGDYAYDSSGNNNNGLVMIGTGGTNSATTTAWSDGASGKINGSLDFDGTDDYIVTPSLTLVNKFTVSAWVKPAAIGSYSRIIENSYESSFYLGLNATGLNYKLIVKKSTSPYGAAEGGIVNLNTWQFVAGVYDGTTGILYVDEKEVARDAFTAPSSFASPVYIGEYFGGSACFWNGLIDDVRIYNYDMNAAQIKQVYNNSKSLYFK